MNCCQLLLFATSLPSSNTCCHHVLRRMRMLPQVRLPCNLHVRLAQSPSGFQTLIESSGFGELFDLLLSMGDWLNRQSEFVELVESLWVSESETSEIHGGSFWSRERERELSFWGYGKRVLAICNCAAIRASLSSRHRIPAGGSLALCDLRIWRSEFCNCVLRIITLWIFGGMWDCFVGWFASQEVTQDCFFLAFLPAITESTSTRLLERNSSFRSVSAHSPGFLFWSSTAKILLRSSGAQVQQEHLVSGEQGRGVQVLNLPPTWQSISIMHS